MRASEKVALGIVVVAFVVAVWLYPLVPDQMPSHWNAAGEVDGYLPKFWGLFLMPIISLGMLLLFVAIPRIDPLKKNLETFRGHFDVFVVILIGFMFYINMLVLLWTLEYQFSIIQALVPAFAVLFFYAGVLIQHSKRNWFVGIRTPWTMSSDRVWEKTHRRGGKLFKAVGVIVLLGMVFEDLAIWILVGPIVAVAVYTMAYSYFEYQKEKRK
jgi:uncharacterized membrane protein